MDSAALSRVKNLIVPKKIKYPLKIVFISDTHGFHADLNLPTGDMIIHAGDISKRGHLSEVLDFLAWYESLDFKYKIFIAGNHDFFFEESMTEEIERIIPNGIIYLNDTGIDIEGISIWGSPVSPRFFDWAFNRDRGAHIKSHWDLIPNKTDILITHGPPLNILDRTIRGDLVGCEDLTNAVKRINPRVHVFGHIHEAYGVIEQAKTKFINASVLDVKYKLVNPPVELNFNLLS